MGARLHWLGGAGVALLTLASPFLPNLVAPAAISVHSLAIGPTPLATVMTSPITPLGWKQLVSAGGPGLINSALSWDPSLGGVLLFGGTTGYTRTGSPVLSNETWEYTNASGWRQLAPHVSPPAREAAVMTYDPTDRYAILFGGETFAATTPITTYSVLNDTWTFANSTWTNRTSSIAPPARAFPRGFEFQVTHCLCHITAGALAFDGRDGFGILLGGVGFQYSYYASNASVTSSWSTYFHDTWRFSAGHWTDLSPIALSSQIPPTNLAMTYDAHDRYFLAFSWAQKIGPQSWKFSGGVWSRIHTHGGPVSNTFLYMTFDWGLGRVVLVGNDHSWCSPCTNVYSFGAGAWTLLNHSTSHTGNAPWGNDYGGGLTYDSGDGYLVLLTGEAYGGVGWNLPLNNQTWAFS